MPSLHFGLSCHVTWYSSSAPLIVPGPVEIAGGGLGEGRGGINAWLVRVGGRVLQDGIHGVLVGYGESHDAASPSLRVLHGGAALRAQHGLLGVEHGLARPTGAGEVKWVGVGGREDGGGGVRTVLGAVGAADLGGVGEIGPPGAAVAPEQSSARVGRLDGLD